MVMEYDKVFIRHGESFTHQQDGMTEITITNLQKICGRWAEETFPKSTPQSVIEHFREEAEEFAEMGDPEEAADCVLLLLHHASKEGYSLLDEVLKKFRTNTKRTWAKEPNEKGYFKHE